MDPIAIMANHAKTVSLVVSESLIGGALVVLGTSLGWRLATARESMIVAVVRWWLDHVVRPLIEGRSWWRRTAIITGNNALTCGAVVVLGFFGPIAWLAVIAVGLSLGVALHLLTEKLPTPEKSDRPDPLDARQRTARTAGLALNMLEIPAIMISAGLSLGQGAMEASVSPVQAWGAFAAVVLPLLLIAAAGEALWIGTHTSLLDRWRDSERQQDP